MLRRRVSELVRTMVSLAPLVGLLEKPEPRPNGISAIVRVKNEEDWTEPSLMSIKDAVEEIIVVDNGSTDRTPEILKRLEERLYPKMRLFFRPDLDYVALSNLGLSQTRYRWLLKWDGDFVAHTSEKRDIQNLRRFLLELDPRRYYLVYLPAVEVAGDLFHQFPDLRIRRDGFVYTASQRARYVPVRGTVSRSVAPTSHRILREWPTVRVTVEALQVPKFYQVLHWNEVTYFHVNVKSARHTLMRHFWLEWLGQGDFRTYSTLESYALARIRDHWGLSDLEEAARRFMAHYCRSLVPVAAELCGPYPELLLPYLSQPRYRVEYRDGVITGRSEPT